MLPLRSRLRPGVAALLAALLAGVLLATAAESAVPGEAGVAGIGDPYFPRDGNGGIDVVHYAVHDTYDLDRRHLRGHTVLTLRATQDLSSFHLDLLLPVRSVRVDGRRAAYDRPDRHELRVTPSHPLAAGATVRVRVAYAGRPGATRWRGERPWLADDHEVVTMGEPHMAARWFPANDHPRDKATFDISITVPRALQVVANGLRVGREVRGRLATTHWRTLEPMAPYLAFFAAGRFAVRSGSRDGLPWTVAVSKAVPSQTRGRSMALMLRTPDVVAWLERQLGAYPFEATGGLTTSLAPGFALENQTRPTYPVLAAGSIGTVVHELAHQWFGDSVSVDTWRDVWLNEGAATFMEARYAETHGGRSAERWLEETYDVIDADDDFWRVPVADPGPHRLFSWAVYVRGGMALEALRRRIDDDPTFWLLLRTWLADHENGNGSTPQLEALAEQVTGLDLTGFFRAWLHTTSRPARTAANGLG